MAIFHHLFVASLLAGAALAHSAPALKQSQARSQAHYEGECKTFVMQKLYEPALFSCYNAYQLGSTDMGAVLYQLGKNHFFDEVTSNNLMQEYNLYKGSPEIQRLLMNIKFSSQSDEVVQGSIYGSWCLDKDMKNETEDRSYEGPSFEGYTRLVLNPTGQYIQASAKIENGRFTYSKNTLTLGHPSFSEYQVKIVGNNQLILKSQSTEKSLEKDKDQNKVYSRKSCSKLGMQRFLQVLVNYKSTTNCDEISNYLGRQLIPAQYLPTAILNKLKQDPKRYQCQQLIQKISEA
ncbi:MAG: hypothetical protein JKY50_13790 [Oleispira sp.]|nr:hypothetical protein [Oleispira sp.]